MNTRLSSRYLILFLALGLHPVQGAVLVREAVNQVVVSATLDGPAKPVTDYAQIQLPACIRTEANARAQLYLSRQGVLRLGAETAVFLEAGADTAELVQGTLVYDHLPRGYRVKATSPDRQIAVRSGTGFAQVMSRHQSDDWTVFVGSLADPVRVQLDEERIELTPGSFVVLPAKGPPATGCFDLPKQVRTSQLLTGFATPLPSQRKLERSVARFRSLQRRGFISRLTEAEPDRAQAGGTSGEFMVIPDAVESRLESRSFDRVRSGLVESQAAGVMFVGDLGFSSRISSIASGPVSSKPSKKKSKFKPPKPPKPPKGPGNEPKKPSKKKR